MQFGGGNLASVFEVQHTLDYPAPRLSGFEIRPKRDGVLTKVGVSQL